MKQRDFDKRICERCDEKYKPNSATQKYCGSRTQKTGCSYEMKNELTLKSARKWDKENPIKKKFYDYRSNSKRRGLNFNLSFEEFEFLVLMSCHYCGEFEGKTTGIDRKDNNRGYTTENSLPCCVTCNTLKSDKEYENFVEECREINRSQKAKIGQNLN